MLRSILLLIFIIFFQGCATWSGVKQDSKTAWQATTERAKSNSSSGT